MKVVLTGATGFIGSHLARRLIADGHEVQAIVRPGSDRWRIADLVGSLDIIERDLADHEAVREALRARQPALCIHSAWRGWSGPSLTAEENLQSLSIGLEFVRTLFHVGCRRFVGVGTCFEYDTDFGVLSEETPTRPRDLYGFSKHSLQAAADHLARLGSLEVAWARVFIVYGPHDDDRRLVPSVALALLRGEEARVTPGEQVRDFLHVVDAADAIWAVARSTHTGPVNIASGVPVTVADMARRIAEAVGRPDKLRVGALPYRAGEPKSLVADTRLLREGIGWRPRYDLDAGLAHAVAWWRGRLAGER